MCQKITFLFLFFFPFTLGAQIESEVDGGGINTALYGSAVCIDQDFALVGAQNTFSCQGLAFMYQRVDSEWELAQTLEPDVCVYGDRFGISVDMDGEYAIIGAAEDDDLGSGSGSVFVYQFQNQNWELVQHLLANDGQVGDEFGISLAIQDEICVIGTKGVDGGGAFYVFQLIDGNWVQTQKVYPPGSEHTDLFGFSIAMTDQYVVVGDYYAAFGGRGRAFVYEINDGQVSYQATLQASDESTGNYYGFSVDIYGDQIIVGAIEESSAAYECGGVYVYQKQGGLWVEQQKLLPTDGIAKDHFGFDVGINDGMILIGSKNHDGTGEDSGAVYEYEKQNDEWIFLEKRIPNGVEADRSLGYSVDLDEDRYIFGAPPSAYIYAPEPVYSQLTTTSTIEFDVSVFPNPSAQNLTITTPPDHPELKCRIINTEGTVLQSFQIPVEEYNTQIKLEEYPNGAYIIEISGGQARCTKPFMLIR